MRENLVCFPFFRETKIKLKYFWKMPHNFTQFFSFFLLFFIFCQIDNSWWYHTQFNNKFSITRQWILKKGHFVCFIAKFHSVFVVKTIWQHVFFYYIFYAVESVHNRDIYDNQIIIHFIEGSHEHKFMLYSIWNLYILEYVDVSKNIIMLGCPPP